VNIAIELDPLRWRQLSPPGQFRQFVHPFDVAIAKVNGEQKLRRALRQIVLPRANQRARMAASVLWEEEGDPTMLPV